MHLPNIRVTQQKAQLQPNYPIGSSARVKLSRTQPCATVHSSHLEDTQLEPRLLNQSQSTQTG